MHIKKLTTLLSNSLFLLLASLPVLGHSQDEPSNKTTEPLQQELQQILQQLQAIEQENARLEQAIQQTAKENQQLGEKLDKLLPGQAPLPATNP